MMNPTTITPDIKMVVHNNINLINETIGALKELDSAFDEAYINSEMTFEERNATKVFFTIAFFESLKELRETGLRCYADSMMKELKSFEEVSKNNPQALCYTERQLAAVEKIGEVFVRLENTELTKL